MVMEFKDGSGLCVYEIVATSSDGQNRSRATQYLRDGRIVRGTKFDEVLVTRDWRGFERNHIRSGT